MLKKFNCIGVYSGIFAIYLKYSSNESRTRTTNIVFYAICLLYVISTAVFVTDSLIIAVSFNSICENIFLSSVVQLDLIYILSPLLQIDLVSILNRIRAVQLTVDSFCDFTSQGILVCIDHSNCIYYPFYSPKSSKIYRCWIIWGKNTRIVIIPLFLAITFLCQCIYLHLISQIQFKFIASSYLACGNFQRK